MLTFKQKFLPAIRSGEKTQTLRIWKYPRVRTGQSNFIPGVGPIWIDSVDEVVFDQLTDEDAVLDGFPSIATLKDEIIKIYGTAMGKMYRVRFHLLPASNENLNDQENRIASDISESESEKSSHQKSENTQKQTNVCITSKVNDSAECGETSSPEFVSDTNVDGVQSLTKEKTSPEKISEETLVFVQQIKEDLAKKVLNLDPKSSMEVTVASTAIESAPESVFLTENQVVEKMIRRCRINRNVCDWNHEPGKSQDFFALFMQSPRNERGIPTLDGYRLRTLIRDQLSEKDWEEISWIVVEVCSAWTEWQYAIEHWDNQE